MTTITLTKARANLSALLKRALKGDDIGIVIEGKIVALRPVEVTSVDYIKSEYDLSSEEWRQVTRNLHSKATRAIKSGKAKRFKRNIEDALR